MVSALNPTVLDMNMIQGKSRWGQGIREEGCTHATPQVALRSISRALLFAGSVTLGYLFTSLNLKCKLEIII